MTGTRTPLPGRRWALRVLWELREDAAPTFRELQQRAGGISSSVLTDRLRELTEAGIVRHGEDDGNGGYALAPHGTGTRLPDRTRARCAGAARMVRGSFVGKSSAVLGRN